MFVVENYAAAVCCCVITMLCWGSWANTQRLAGKNWRFELFYWDYAFGTALMILALCLTLGSFGSSGRSLLADIRQAEPGPIGSAIVGGVVFNAANILLVAAIDIAGMAVAFPVGIGLALVLGVMLNYWADPVGNPKLLFAGVGLIVAAMICAALAHRARPGQDKAVGVKGLLLSLVSGLLMGSFYRFVAASMSTDFHDLAPGKLGPYSALLFFAVGLLASNFVFNTALMRWPTHGSPVAAADYFRGTARDHLCGILGGATWAVGMTLSIVAAGQAGFAISYGLGQGATLVAACWGVFIWHEFRDARPGTGRVLALMFAGYLAGLGLIIAAKLA
ncbi:MAG TPA: GRP family sugar transporter [Pirellulales bacterium]|jgi:glucose uptake protein